MTDHAKDSDQKVAAQPPTSDAPTAETEPKSPADNLRAASQVASIKDLKQVDAAMTGNWVALAMDGSATQQKAGPDTQTDTASAVAKILEKGGSDSWDKVIAHLNADPATAKGPWNEWAESGKALNNLVTGQSEPEKVKAALKTLTEQATAGNAFSRSALVNLLLVSAGKDATLAWISQGQRTRSEQPPHLADLSQMNPALLKELRQEVASSLGSLKPAPLTRADASALVLGAVAATRDNDQKLHQVMIETLAQSTREFPQQQPFKQGLTDSFAQTRPNSEQLGDVYLRSANLADLRSDFSLFARLGYGGDKTGLSVLANVTGNPRDLDLADRAALVLKTAASNPAQAATVSDMLIHAYTQNGDANHLLHTLGAIYANKPELPAQVRQTLHHGTTSADPTQENGRRQYQSAMQGLMEVSPSWTQADLRLLAAQRSPEAASAFRVYEHLIPSEQQRQLLAQIRQDLDLNQNVPMAQRKHALDTLAAFAVHADRNDVLKLAGYGDGNGSNGGRLLVHSGLSKPEASQIQVEAAGALLNISQRAADQTVRQTAQETLLRHSWGEQISDPVRNELSSYAAGQPERLDLSQQAAKHAYTENVRAPLAEVFKRQGISGTDAEFEQAAKAAVANHGEETVRAILDRVAMVNALPPNLRKELTGVEQTIDSRQVIGQMINGTLKDSSNAFLNTDIKAKFEQLRTDESKKAEQTNKELNDLNERKTQLAKELAEHTKEGVGFLDRLAFWQNNPEKFEKKQQELVAQIKEVERQIAEKTQAAQLATGRAQLLELSQKAGEHSRLMQEGKVLDADKKAMEIWGQFGNMTPPPVMRELTGPGAFGKNAFERLKEAGLAVSDKMPPLAAGTKEGFQQGLKTLTEIRGGSQSAAVDVPAIRQNALRAVDSAPEFGKLLEGSQKLATHLPVLQQMFTSGMEGTKYEDFVKDARARAEEIDKALKDIEPHVQGIKDRIEDMKKAEAATQDEQTKKELQDRIKKLEDSVKFFDPNSAENKQFKHMIEMIRSSRFDENTFVNWLKRDGLIIGVAIVAAVATIATLGAAAPALVAAAGFTTWMGLGASLTIAAVGTAGGLVGQELAKEGLYHANNALGDVGLGQHEQSRVGAWIGDKPVVDPITGEERQRTFLGDVLVPYTVDFAKGTAITFATMGVGHFLARGINAGLARLGPTKAHEFLVRNSTELQQLGSRSRAVDQMIKEQGSKAFSKRFLESMRHELPDEFMDEAKEEVAGEAVQKMVGQSNSFLGMLASAAVAGAKGVRFDSYHRGRQEITFTAETPAALDALITQFKRDGHQVKQSGGNLEVRTPEGTVFKLRQVSDSEAESETANNAPVTTDNNLAPVSDAQTQLEFIPVGAGAEVGRGRPETPNGTADERNRETSIARAGSTNGNDAADSLHDVLQQAKNQQEFRKFNETLEAKLKEAFPNEAVQHKADFDKLVGRLYQKLQAKPEEAAKVLRAVDQILSAEKLAVNIDAQQRVGLAKQLLNEAVHPNIVDQGTDNTCGPAVVQEMSLHDSPGSYTEALASLITTGKFTTQSPRPIVVDLSQDMLSHLPPEYRNVLQPDNQARRSLAEAGKAGSEPVIDGQRTYASQLAQLLAANIHTQNAQSGQRAVYVKGPRGEAVTGERLFAISDQPQFDMVLGTDGKPKIGPGIQSTDLQPIWQALTGNATTNDFVLVNTTEQITPGRGQAFQSPEQFNQMLLQGPGRYVVEVDPDHPLFNQGIETTGNDGGPSRHVVLVELVRDQKGKPVIDQATGTAMLNVYDQYGRARDLSGTNAVSSERLFEATQNLDGERQIGRRDVDVQDAISSLRSVKDRDFGPRTEGINKTLRYIHNWLLYDAQEMPPGLDRSVKALTEELNTFPPNFENIRTQLDQSEGIVSRIQANKFMDAIAAEQKGIEKTQEFQRLKKLILDDTINVGRFHTALLRRIPGETELAMGEALGIIDHISNRIELDQIKKALQSHNSMPHVSEFERTRLARAIDAKLRERHADEYLSNSAWFDAMYDNNISGTEDVLNAVNLLLSPQVQASQRDAWNDLYRQTVQGKASDERTRELVDAMQARAAKIPPPPTSPVIAPVETRPPNQNRRGPTENLSQAEQTQPATETIVEQEADLDSEIDELENAEPPVDRLREKYTGAQEVFSLGEEHMARLANPKMDEGARAFLDEQMAKLPTRNPDAVKDLLNLTDAQLVELSQIRHQNLLLSGINAGWGHKAIADFLALDELSQDLLVVDFLHQDFSAIRPEFAQKVFALSADNIISIAENKHYGTLVNLFQNGRLDHDTALRFLSLDPLEQESVSRWLSAHPHDTRPLDIDKALQPSEQPWFNFPDRVSPKEFLDSVRTLPESADGHPDIIRWIALAPNEFMHPMRKGPGYSSEAYPTGPDLEQIVSSITSDNLSQLDHNQRETLFTRLRSIITAANDRSLLRSYYAQLGQLNAEDTTLLNDSEFTELTKHQLSDARLSGLSESERVQAIDQVLEAANARPYDAQVYARILNAISPEHLQQLDSKSFLSVLSSTDLTDPDQLKSFLADPSRAQITLERAVDLLVNEGTTNGKALANTLEMLHATNTERFISVLRSINATSLSTLNKDVYQSLVSKLTKTKLGPADMMASQNVELMHKLVQAGSRFTLNEKVQSNLVYLTPPQVIPRLTPEQLTWFAKQVNDVVEAHRNKPDRSKLKAGEFALKTPLTIEEAVDKITEESVDKSPLSNEQAAALLESYSDSDRRIARDVLQERSRFLSLDAIREMFRSPEARETLASKAKLVRGRDGNRGTTQELNILVLGEATQGRDLAYEFRKATGIGINIKVLKAGESIPAGDWVLFDRAPMQGDPSYDAFEHARAEAGDRIIQPDLIKDLYAGPNVYDVLASTIPGRTDLQDRLNQAIQARKGGPLDTTSGGELTLAEVVEIQNALSGFDPERMSQRRLQTMLLLAHNSKDTRPDLLAHLLSLQGVHRHLSPGQEMDALRTIHGDFLGRKDMSLDGHYLSDNVVFVTNLDRQGSSNSVTYLYRLANGLGGPQFDHMFKSREEIAGLPDYQRSQLKVVYLDDIIYTGSSLVYHKTGKEGDADAQLSGRIPKFQKDAKLSADQIVVAALGGYEAGLLHAGDYLDVVWPRQHTFVDIPDFIRAQIKQGNISRRLGPAPTTKEEIETAMDEVVSVLRSPTYTVIGTAKKKAAAGEIEQADESAINAKVIAGLTLPLMVANNNAWIVERLAIYHGLAKAHSEVTIESIQARRRLDQLSAAEQESTAPRPISYQFDPSRRTVTDLSDQSSADQTYEEGVKRDEEGYRAARDERQIDWTKATKLDSGTHTVSSGIFEISGDAEVTVTGDAVVKASGRAVVTASGNSTVYASENSEVYSNGMTDVYIGGNAFVRASGESIVTAQGAARIDAHGRSRVNASNVVQVRAHDATKVDAKDRAKVESDGNAEVSATDRTEIKAAGSSTVYAGGNSKVTARDRSRVFAKENSLVTASGDASINARGNAHIEASGSSSVFLMGTSTAKVKGNVKATASAQAHVLARGKATVTAKDQATVEAMESAVVKAWGISQVEAFDNARVVANDASSAVLHDTAHADATSIAAITQNDRSTVTRGGQAKLTIPQLDPYGGKAEPAYGEDSPVLQVLRQNRESVVQILTTKDGSTGSSGGAGTGFFVTEKGELATALHVVADAQEGGIKIKLPNGQVYKATVVAIDPSSDTALLQAEAGTPVTSVADLAESTETDTGIDVMILGHPDARSTLTASVGTSTGTKTFRDYDRDRDIRVGEDFDLARLNLTAKAHEGSSGSPVYRLSDGKVIGVATRGGSDALSTLATRASHIRAMIASREANRQYNVDTGNPIVMPASPTTNVASGADKAASDGSNGQELPPTVSAERDVSAIVSGAHSFVHELTTSYPQVDAEGRLNYYLSGSLATTLMLSADQVRIVDSRNLPQISGTTGLLSNPDRGQHLARFARPIGDLDFVPLHHYKKAEHRLSKGGSIRLDELSAEARSVLKASHGQVALMGDPLSPAGGEHEVAVVTIDGRDYYIASPNSMLSYKLIHIAEKFGMVDTKTDKLQGDFDALLSELEPIYGRDALVKSAHHTLMNYGTNMANGMYIPTFSPEFSGEMQKFFEQVIASDPNSHYLSALQHSQHRGIGILKILNKLPNANSKNAVVDFVNNHPDLIDQWQIAGSENNRQILADHIMADPGRLTEFAERTPQIRGELTREAVLTKLSQISLHNMSAEFTQGLDLERVPSSSQTLDLLLHVSPANTVQELQQFDRILKADIDPWALSSLVQEGYMQDGQRRSQVLTALAALSSDIAKLPPHLRTSIVMDIAKGADPTETVTLYTRLANAESTRTTTSPPPVPSDGQPIVNPIPTVASTDSDEEIW